MQNITVLDGSFAERSPESGDEYVNLLNCTWNIDPSSTSPGQIRSTNMFPLRTCYQVAWVAPITPSTSTSTSLTPSVITTSFTFTTQVACRTTVCKARRYCSHTNDLFCCSRHQLQIRVTRCHLRCTLIQGRALSRLLRTSASFARVLQHRFPHVRTLFSAF